MNCCNSCLSFSESLERSIFCCREELGESMIVFCLHGDSWPELLGSFGLHKEVENRVLFFYRDSVKSCWSWWDCGWKSIIFALVDRVDDDAWHVMRPLHSSRFCI